MSVCYDVLVIGAGPAGLMASTVAAQNGLKVVLLERKSDIAKVRRSCATMFAIEDDYLFGERMFFNNIKGRFVFPVNGFSVPYSGPYKNFYGQVLYAPDGKTCVHIGNYEENVSKNDEGRLSIVYDKESLLREMLTAAIKSGVEIVAEMNVQDIQKSKERVHVTTSSGDRFEGIFAIAADGLNSRSAQILGCNKRRKFYGTVKALSYEVSNISLPEPQTYKMTNIFEPTHRIPLTYGIVPRATGEDTYWLFIGGPVDERISYEKELQHFMHDSPFSSWFANVSLGKKSCAVLNFWSPVEEPFQDNVLIIGDAAWSIEAEITGSLMCGWKAAHAVTVAFQDKKYNREGVESYLTWWRDSFLRYDYQGYLRSLAMLYVLNAEDVVYVYSQFEKPLPCTLNPHKLQNLMNEAIAEHIPRIQAERPEILAKFQKIATEPLDELLTPLKGIYK